MASLLRQLVAGPRAQHPEAGFDLCYVTPNIIATSGPSQSFPRRAYRTPLDRLVAFLDAKHQDGWAIWEFRAEGTGYPDEAVYGRIRHYPWPDHHPPPFRLIPLMMASMRNWLDGGPLAGPAQSTTGDLDHAPAPPSHPNPARVAVLHCKAGKGRSGTVAVSYLISECGQTSAAALARFTEQRMRPFFGAGVSIPSQIRWIGYVEQWVKGGKRFVDGAVEILEVHAWGLRNDVRVAVSGFADEGKQIVVAHTFDRSERIVVEGQPPGGSGVADMLYDMAGYTIDESRSEMIGTAGTTSMEPNVIDSRIDTSTKPHSDGRSVPDDDAAKFPRDPDRYPSRPIDDETGETQARAELDSSMPRAEQQKDESEIQPPTQTGGRLFDAEAAKRKLKKLTRISTISRKSSPTRPAGSRNGSPVRGSAAVLGSESTTSPLHAHPNSDTDSPVETDGNSDEPGGRAVIFKARTPIRIANRDVLISLERRTGTGRSMGLTVVTAVAHAWFNVYFEGAAGGVRTGVFDITWDEMDGIKGSRRKGTRAADRIAVVWRAVDEETNHGSGVSPGSTTDLPQMRAADWRVGDPAGGGEVQGELGVHSTDGPPPAAGGREQADAGYEGEEMAVIEGAVPATE